MKNKCPCCGLATLTTRHDYEICSYCQWEDEPIQEGAYSAANGGTIRQYTVKKLGVRWVADIEKSE